MAVLDTFPPHPRLPLLRCPARPRCPSTHRRRCCSSAPRSSSRTPTRSTRGRPSVSRTRPRGSRRTQTPRPPSPEGRALFFPLALPVLPSPSCFVCFRVRCGLTVRMVGSHPIDPGSIPGIGISLALGRKERRGGGEIRIRGGTRREEGREGQEERRKKGERGREERAFTRRKLFQCLIFQNIDLVSLGWQLGNHISS